MNKERTAVKLGISVRTLQRYMSARRVAFTMKRTKMGEAADFDKAEIDRFKRELKDGLTHAVSHPALALTEPVSLPIETALQVLPRPNIEDVRQRAIVLEIAKAIEAVRASTPTLIDTAQKFTLSLIEASRLSGLSRGHLREAIETKKLKARIIGRGWRVKRDDLEAYVRKL